MITIDNNWQAEFSSAKIRWVEFDLDLNKINCILNDKSNQDECFLVNCQIHTYFILFINQNPLS